jgi:hypothetical protein
MLELMDYIIAQASILPFAFFHISFWREVYVPTYYNEDIPFTNILKLK